MLKLLFKVDKEADKQMCSNHFYSKSILGFDFTTKPEEFVEKVYSEKINEIIDSKNKLQESWAKVNDRVIERLAEIMQISWPDKKGVGIMTINKICPRSLKNWDFYVSYFLDVEKQKGIVLHEITHFLYFEKWKQIFPNYKEKDFEAFSLIWELSEILVEPIDRDDELVSLVPATAKAYKRYYTTKINDKENIITHFSELYNRNKSNFGNMLKIAYAEIEKLRLFKNRAQET
ncbi:MAG: hypothetical protein ACP5RI_01835 [Candidatus Micrarchaeia archaeon]